MTMIYIVAFFSGSRLITTNVNLWYIKNRLKGSSQEFTFFNIWTPVAYDFKPLFSFVSEVFFPLRYRIKTYVPAAAFLVFIGSIVASIIDLTYWPFFICVLMQSIGFSIVDALGEGLTAEVVKIDKRIVLISSTLDPNLDIEANTKKAFGNFYNFRMFITNLSLFYGSSFVERFQSLTPFYGTQVVISAILITYSIFFFEEERKDRAVMGAWEMLVDIWVVLRYVFEPTMFIPFGYYLVVNCIPNLGDAGNYMLINLGNWDIADLGYQQIIFGLIYVFALGYVINVMRNISLGWVFIIMGITNGFYYLFNFLFVYS